LANTSINFGSLEGTFFEKAALKNNRSRRKTAQVTEESEKTTQLAAIEIPPLRPEHYRETQGNHLDNGKLASDTPSLKRSGRKAEVVEEIDEEEEIWRLRPTAENGILEASVMEADETEAEDRTPRVKNWESKRRAREASKFSRMVEDFWLNDGRLFPQETAEEEESDVGEEAEADSDCSSEPELRYGKKETFLASMGAKEALTSPVKHEQTTPGPPKELTSIRLYKKRKTRPGKSALCTSVLSMKGTIVDPAGELIDLRVDTCADVTLISEELYRSFVNPPPIRLGLPMKLVQLTHEESDIKGYVTVPIFVMTEEGQLIETEAEAYVVPGMSVPILLGEDYQINYEIALTRNVESGSKLHFQNWQYTVRAQHVSRTNDLGRTLFSNQVVSKQVRAKRHRAKLVKEKRRRAKFGEERTIVRAAHDYRIRPHECRSILLEGYFEEDKEWLVEKNLLANANDSYFTIGNTLISSLNPWLPVSNPTSQPRIIRKGEILGTLRDPQDFFDKPRSEDNRKKFAQGATAMATIIQANLRREAEAKEHENHGESRVETCGICFPKEKEEEAEAEDYGPKTAAMPDPETYDSTRLRDLIDVGTLPEELKEAAWKMLEKRVRAFGFDGRLGHHPSKIHIRTEDGQVPIAVPMYGSSPAKRQVIDEQIDKWFEQGVIEPSISPWSAPVVIAYRNGKPRFCVDYRKLNAATIPDEFPIPRQSEILSAVSGAQVLSSLDALAGFTQLEVAEEDVEKTAFRTHRGLFQFRRMPFGLRNGPSIFQRVMQGILAPYLWIFCLVYIDDIVIYSKSYEEHIIHLDLVLKAIEEAGIMLSPGKCHLFYDSILLLGHKVSRLGLSTHEEKVKAILELERPTKLLQLQTFLGMVVYFSAFIPFYADICGPLFHLLRKDCRWKWERKEEHTFRQAKDALRSAPLLGHPIEGLLY
jgi:hypothetical protein